MSLLFGQSTNEPLRGVSKQNYVVGPEEGLWNAQPVPDTYYISSSGIMEPYYNAESARKNTLLEGGFGGVAQE